jgi:NADH-quinone oxidoreductase subunit J
MELAAFLLLAFVAVVGALVVICHRHPVYSALGLVATMLCIAFLFLLLRAEFLWVIQITVYAGAVMVLFLFVIMLLDLRREDRPWHFPENALRGGLGVILAVALVVELALAVVAVRGHAIPGGGFTPERLARAGHTQLIGEALYTDYLFPFEVTSVILLVAIVGAVVLARKRAE